MNKGSKIPFIVASIVAIVVLVATYCILAPGNVVANEASTTYSEVKTTTNTEATVKVYDSQPVGASVSENDPKGAEQALGAAELVEVSQPPAAEEVQTFTDETGTTYTKVQTDTSPDGKTINVYESEEVNFDDDSGLGSAELIEVTK